MRHGLHQSRSRSKPSQHKPQPGQSTILRKYSGRALIWKLGKIGYRARAICFAPRRGSLSRRFTGLLRRGDQKNGNRQQQEKEITPTRCALDKTSGWPSEAAKETETSQEVHPTRMGPNPARTQILSPFDCVKNDKTESSEPRTSTPIAPLLGSPGRYSPPSEPD